MKPVANYLEDNPVFTLLAVLVVIAAIAGAIVCAVNSDALTFEEYLDNLGKFAIALGTYAIGKGLFGGASRVADAVAPAPLAEEIAPLSSEAEAEAAFQEAAVPAGSSPLLDPEGETQAFPPGERTPPPAEPKPPPV